MKKRFCAIMIFLLSVFMLTACTRGEKEQQIVLTTGFDENEVFFIDTEKCYLPEINIYMRTSQSQYENVYGEEIWSRRIGGQTLEQRLKDMALSRLARIKTMKLLAGEMGVELTEDEIKKCQKAAESYMASLSDEDIALLGADYDTVYAMYSEYALADNVYKHITDSVNPEISDDEARIITVEQILIKKDPADTERIKQDKYERAQTVLQRLENGEDFDTLADRYNEDSRKEYSFARDAAMPENLIEIAFSLDNDELSNIVETEYGYHILKCINTFDTEETDANKLQILNKRKEEEFSRVYDEFVQKCYSDLNTELWQSVTFDRSLLQTDKSFFDVYYEEF